MSEKWSLLVRTSSPYPVSAGFSTRELRCLLVALFFAGTCLFLVRNLILNILRKHVDESR
jgi:hypothetical protein